MIERVFLGWDKPILPLAARYLADSGRRGGTLDLRGSVVAVPGSRAGRRLKELLLNEATASELRFAPPRVITVGALPELFYSPESPAASTLLRRRIWAQALLAVDARRLSRVFGRLPERTDLRGWDLLASEIASLHRETASGGHTFGDVVRVCGGGELGFDDGERWTILEGVQKEYSRRLAGLRYGDPDRDRIAAARSGRLHAEQEVILVGVPELATITESILRRAESRVIALVHAPAEEGSAFGELGLVRPEAWSARPISLASEQWTVADRPTGQAAEVLRELAASGDLNVHDVVVAAADEKVVPYLEEWLSSAGIETHDAAGTPVRLTGPCRLLDAVRDYLERPGWEEFAALIRHPDLEPILRGGEEQGSVTLGSVDRFFCDHLTSELRGALPSGRHPGATRARERLEAPALLGQLRKELPLAKWAAPIVSLLVEIYGSLDANPSDPAGERTVAALRELRTAALALHRLPATMTDRTDAAFAIHLLLQEIGSRTIADDGDREAIELVGWLELPFDDAGFVIVTGVNEGALPESRSAHPFLPDRLRSQLGLLDNAGRYARDAFLLTGLLHSRKRIRLVSGRTTADGDPLRPSRLTLATSGDALARRVLEFVEGETPTVRPPLLAAAVPVSGFALPPEPSLRFDPPASLPVTAFAGIIADPYRWVLERVHRLRRYDDEAREMDGAAFGTLAHKVLSRFGRSDERSSRDPRAIAALLGRYLDEAADATFAGLSFPAVQIQVEHLRHRLNHFAEWQARWAGQGWEIVLVEGAAVGTAISDAPEVVASFEVDGEPVGLTGRIDRVDRNTLTGQIAILDYKTSEEPKTPDEVHRRKNGEWLDLQLPLYRRLLAATVGPEGGALVDPDADVRVGYILLSRSTELISEELADWGDADLLAAEEVAANVVRWLRGGAVEFVPGESRHWPGDPLAPLFGARQLLAAEAEEEQEATVG